MIWSSPALRKNLGPAGVTIALVKKSSLDRGCDIEKLPGYLSYANHITAGSRFNTPPVFPIYVVNLVLEWIEQEFGSLEKVAIHNRAQAGRVYQVIDRYPDLYLGHAHKECRSSMNITFRFPTEADQDRFVEEAGESGLVGLAGHRSVGGIRASLYNAMTDAGVERLAEFMESFARRAGGKNVSGVAALT